MDSKFRIFKWPLATFVIYGLCRSFIYDKIGLPFWTYINLSEGLWFDSTICLASVGAFLFSKSLYARHYSSTHKGLFYSLLILLLLFNLDNDTIPYLLFLGICPSWIPIAVSAFIAFKFGGYKRSKKILNKEESESPLLFKDDPIKTADRDEFAFNHLAKRIVASIERTNVPQSFSIGITGAWGSGKTSLLNLVKENLSKDDKNVIIEYSPRQSASVEDIQRDFLGALGDELVKYHSGMLKLMSKYSQAIGVLPDNLWIARLFFGYSYLSSKQLREDINIIIRASKLRVIILLDDFDRLTGDEIKEVLKLIDKNAAFSNTFFLTAYDKEHTNGVIKQSLNENMNSDYTDKYFSLEIPMPIRQQGHYVGVLHKHVLEMVKHYNLPYSESEIDSALSRVRPFIKDYLPTVRDIRRFVNYVGVAIDAVKNDVLLDDFMLVSLIRYKYPLEFKNLMDEQYITYFDNRIKLAHFPAGNQPYSHGVLKNLFALGKYHYRSIKRTDSFNFYFYDIDAGHLSLIELRKVLKQNISNEEFRDIVQPWIQRKDYRHDFIEFILSRREHIHSKGAAKDYVKLFMLARTFCNDYSLYIESLSYLRDHNVDENMRAFGFSSTDEYVRFFKTVFTESYDDILPIAFMHDALHAVTNIKPNDAPSLIFTFEELISWAQARLDKIISNVALGKGSREDVFNAMKACVVEFDPEGNGESISHNAKEQVRTAILNNPEIYLKKMLTHKVINDNVIQFSLVDDLGSIVFNGPADFNLFLNMCSNRGLDVIDNCLYEYAQRCLAQNTMTPSLSIRGDVNEIIQHDYAMYNKLFEAEPTNA